MICPSSCLWTWKPPGAGCRDVVRASRLRLDAQSTSQLTDHSFSYGATIPMILTEEQEMIRDTAREFAQRHLVPYAAEWDRTATFPRDALREMGKLGFLGMTVPADWGGAGTDYVSYALAMEEIAAGDAATVMSGHNSVGCGPVVAF